MVKNFTQTYIKDSEKLPPWWDKYSVPFDTAITYELDERYHSHDFYEIFYVEAGSINHLIEQKEQVLYDNDLFFIIPNVYHGFKRFEGVACTHRDILIGESLLKEVCTFHSPTLFAEITSTPYIHIKPSRNDIATLNEYISKYYQIRNSNDINKTQLFTMVKLIVSYLLGLLYISNTDRYLTPTNTIDQLYTHLSLSVYNEQSISEVLDKFHYNKSYLCRIFKEHSGITMMEYVNKIKLERATNLLLYTDIEISRISMQLGFSSESYFFKKFKAQYGVTPLQFRKNHGFIDPK